MEHPACKKKDLREYVVCRNEMQFSFCKTEMRIIIFFGLKMSAPAPSLQISDFSTSTELIVVSVY